MKGMVRMDGGEILHDTGSKKQHPHTSLISGREIQLELIKIRIKRDVSDK